MTDSGQTVIQAVQFLDELVHISFAEPRDQGERVAMGRSLYIQLDVVEEEVGEVLDLLRDIIDKSLIDLRNPKDTLKGDSHGTLDAEAPGRLE